MNDVGSGTRVAVHEANSQLLQWPDGSGAHPCRLRDIAKGSEMGGEGQCSGEDWKQGKRAEGDVVQCFQVRAATEI